MSYYRQHNNPAEERHEKLMSCGTWAMAVVFFVVVMVLKACGAL